MNAQSSDPGPVDSVRDREARLAAILATAIDGIVTIDERGVVESVNQAAADLFGYEASDILGQNISMLMPEPYRSAHDGYIRRYLTEGDPRIIGLGREVPGQRKDGAEFPFWLSVSEIRVGDGRRTFCGIIHDLTAIRGEQAKMGALLDAAADAIFTLSADGCVDSINQAGADLFGYARDELVGLNIAHLMPGPHDGQGGYIEQYLQAGDRRAMGAGRVVTCRRKNGATFDGWTSMGHFEITGRRYFTLLVHDLSDLRAAEEELSRTRQMAVLGEMSAAIAHEIKNPLAATSAALQVLRGGFDDKDRRAAIVDRILERVTELDATVRRLLAFAKTWEPNRRAVPFRALIDPVVKLIEDDPRFGQVRIRVDAPAGVALYVDAELCSQVFVNLVQNAGEAAMGKGRIDIRACAADGGMRVSVVDDGPGMAPEVRARLFEPFFTTKENGTGLGLPICQKILRAHGGSLDVESKPGAGTEVRLFFPDRG